MRVTVAVAAPAPDTVWVRVQDRGVGIPKKQLKRIFNRFYRVQARGLQATSRAPGSGSTSCARSRASHGGRVFAQSEGEGQRRHVHAGAAATAGSRRAAVRMSRILIVEDEQHIADGLASTSKPKATRPSSQHDGEQALDLLLKERHAFDVVVLDVMLPGKDGFTVAAELRAAEQFVPILMLTARGRPEDVLKGFEAGADDYLPKPFELTILLARIHGLLRRRRWNEQDAPQPGDAHGDVYSFAGRTLDFGAMEVRALGKSHRLTQMECDLLRYLVQQRRAGRVARRRFSRTSGDCTRAPTRGRSTTSSCGCGGISRTVRRRRRSCSPYAASATSSSRRRAGPSE